MGVLTSALDVRGETFQRNATAMRALLDELQAREAAARAGGGAKGAAKFRERHKLLPRERIARLLDADAPFLELSTLAAWDMYDNECPAAAEITGIGMVCGVECM